MSLTALAPVVVANAPALELLATGPMRAADVAEALGGRDIENTRKALLRLVEEGAATRSDDHVFALTPAGERIRLGLAVASGAAPAPTAGGGQGVLQVRPGDIDVNPANPRTQMDELGLEELAVSIVDKGVLQPLTARPVGDPPRLQLVIGERRWTAAQLAIGRGWLPEDFTLPVIVREMDDAEVAEVALVENLHREDLNVVDECEALKALADMGRSAAQIQRLVGGERGRSKRSIQEYIQFARELSDEDKARLRSGEIGVDQARFLVGHKRPRPSLDLTPRLALTLVEIAHATGLRPVEVRGEPRYVRLGAKPKGGPVLTLADKGLISFKVDGGDAFARVALHSSDAGKYLEEIGFDADPDAAVFKAREAVVGEMAAKALADQGAYSTPELNPPEDRREAPPAPAGGDGIFAAAPPPAAEPEAEPAPRGTRSPASRPRR
jgi:ParB/RepB/Spo0J family partition protein